MSTRKASHLDFDQSPNDDKSQAALESRMKQIRHVRVRYGYCRIRLLLNPEN
ncbi:hypothetical protein [Bradyrhizobium japonicum]|uniref:hypothetical protein n=1 Tax=Bradyrhizobium japonicum TaxID=375 RepID=UPI0004AF86FA|nr:hypothetical protein [Bradyrhizobium japonicum]